MRANGSRERAPDDRLREAIHFRRAKKDGLLPPSLVELRRTRSSQALPCANAPRLSEAMKGRASAISRRGASEWMHGILALENRGRRESRVANAPAASRAKIKKHTSVVTTGSPDSSGLPCAMVLTVSFVLSRVTGLVCHPPFPRIASRKLDASVGASGPHDFTVRQKRSRLQHYRRPPHPAPHVRDDRETPLVQERDKMATTLVLPGRQANF